MASIVPFGLGAGLAGLSGGFGQGMQLAAQLAQMQDTRKLRELQSQAALLQIEEAQRKSQDLSQLRGTVIPQLMGLRAPPSEVLPAQPPSVIPTGPPPTPGAGVWDFQRLSPGQPAVTVPQLTHERVGEQLGQSSLGLLMTTPEGREALKARGVMSTEEAERQLTKRRALEQMRRSFKDALDFYQADKETDGLLAEMRGLHDAMEAADEPAQAAQLRTAYTQLFAIYRETRADDREKTAMRQDLGRQSRAMAAFNADPSLDNATALVETSQSATSTLGVKRGFTILDKLQSNAFEQMPFVPLRRVVTRALELGRPAAEAGQPIPFLTTMQQALQDNPRDASLVFGHFMEQMARGKDIPNELKQFFFQATDVSKSELEMAQRFTALDRVSPTHPQYQENVLTKLAAIRAAGKADVGLKELQGAFNTLVRLENTLSDRLRVARDNPQEEANLNRELKEVEAMRRAVVTKLQQEKFLPAPEQRQPELADPPPPPSGEKPGSPRYDQLFEANLRLLLNTPGYQRLPPAEREQKLIEAFRRKGWQAK